jgi:hypothetical protein
VSSDYFLQVLVGFVFGNKEVSTFVCLPAGAEAKERQQEELAEEHMGGWHNKINIKKWACGIFSSNKHIK